VGENQELNLAKSVFWLIIIFGITAGLSLISIKVPLARDQGVASYLGWQILEGRVIYRDLYHFNFPGIFWTYALAFKLFGLKPISVNLFDLLFRLLTLLGVYLASARIFGTRTGLWAGLVYGLTSTVFFNDWWLNAQKETFALGGLAYSFYFFIRGKEGRRFFWGWFLVFGLFSFWAMLYKPTVILAPGMLGLYLIFSQRIELKKRVIGILMSALGFILPLIFFVGYLWSRQALDDMIEQVFIFGSQYGGQFYAGGIKTVGWVLWKIIKWGFEFGFLVASSLLGLNWLIKQKNENFRLVVWFGLGLFLNLLVQLKFFDYHFMVLILPLSIFSGVFLNYLSQANSERARLWVLFIFLVIANFTPGIARYRAELLYDFGKVSQEHFLSRYGRWGFGDICARSFFQVSQYLRSHSNKEDGVLVFGLEPGINFYAQRRSPTRFSYDLPLTYHFGKERFKAYQKRLQEEFIAGLKSNPPIYIVVVEKDNTAIEPKDSFQQCLEFIELREFLRENYYLETKIEHYYMYRRK